MSKKSKQQDLEVVGDRPPVHRVISGTIKTIVALLVVVYFALYFAARTDGFRSFVEDKFEQHLALKVRIQKTWATPTLDLVIQDLKANGGGEHGEPGFHLQKAVVRWSLRNIFSPERSILRGLAIEDCRVSFAPDESGRWQPLALEKLANWVAEWGKFQLEPGKKKADPDAEKNPDVKPGKLPDLSPDFWESIQLSVTDSQVVWSDADGRELAEAGGIAFNITPVRLPNRKMTHYLLKIGKGGVTKGKQIEDFVFEMLQFGSNSLVLACGEWGTREKSRVVSPEGQTQKSGSVIPRDHEPKTGAADPVRKQASDPSSD